MSTDIASVTTAAGSIRNPILSGFHPDPSILRVGDDYYLATSTFEWYPGVRVHHSRDLVHWRALGGVITERRLLDLRGAGDSNGVWAPDLSYADGLFHLVYSDVASFASGYWDPQNYLITAPAIDGPWSDPIPLHAHGFDASLFHDADGSSWLLAMSADWRPGRDRFGGIEIQRYDRTERRLVGDARLIFHGTEAGLTEGPHLYRHDGWYYLVTAEGGTSWEHQVSVARSRSLFGPYLADPAGPLLTSVGRPELRLQKAGHGSLVRTQTGQWYLAHLVGRPYTPLGNCVLGRETALQRVEWPVGGWPAIAGGVPADEIAAPDLPAHPGRRHRRPTTSRATRWGRPGPPCAVRRRRTGSTCPVAPLTCGSSVASRRSGGRHRAWSPAGSVRRAVRWRRWWSSTRPTTASSPASPATTTPRTGTTPTSPAPTTVGGRWRC